MAELAFEVPMKNIFLAMETGDQRVPFLGEKEALKVSMYLAKAVVRISVHFGQFRIDFINKEGYPVITAETRRRTGSGGSSNSVDIPIGQLVQAIKDGADKIRVEQLPS